MRHRHVRLAERLRRDRQQPTARSPQTRAITRLLAGPAAATEHVVAPMDAAAGARPPAPASPSRSAARRSPARCSGNSTVPIGSACTIGLSDTRPSSRAVGSPSRSAVHACAISCTVSENSRTMNDDENLREVDVQQGVKVTADSRKTQGRHRPFSRRRRPPAPRASRAGRPRGCRTSSAASAAACGPMPGTSSSSESQVAHRPRAPVERDGESMRLVADPLDQQQRRIVGGQRDRVLAIAREQQLFLLGDADGDEIREPQLFERRVAPPTAVPCRRRSAIRSGNGPPCSSSLR